jgi:hypothetical protein
MKSPAGDCEMLTRQERLIRTAAGQILETLVRFPDGIYLGNAAFTCLQSGMTLTQFDMVIKLLTDRKYVVIYNGLLLSPYRTLPLPEPYHAPNS